MPTSLPDFVVEELIDLILSDFCFSSLKELLELLSKEYEEYNLNADVLTTIIDEAGLSQCDKCGAWTAPEDMYHGTCHLCLSDIEKDEESYGIRKMRDSYST
jgi:Co/Zn/Cd efflux system component